MTTTVLETGAVFKLVDEFSGPGRRLLEMLGGAQKEVTELQARLDKLTIAPFVTRATRSFEEFEKLAAGAFGSLETEAKGGVDGALGALGRLGTGAAAELDKVKVASATAWTAISDGAKVSTDAAIASLGRLNAAAESSVVKMRGVAAISSSGDGASLAHRAASGPHGGMHLRGHGMSIPGGHVGFSGDGTVQAVGAFGGYEILKGAAERGMEMDKIAAQYLASGFNVDQIAEARRAAWANTRGNPNIGAIDSFADILELNKATGSLSESIETLPAITRVDTLMKSLKAKGLKAEYNRDGQILNFAKGLEELGVTQMGSTQEERQANIERYTTELMRTMVSSRGLFDPNALFAMTNNSGGAAANWDERMATVVAPILGDIMKHSKLGNADYMALKSYAGGGITSKAVQALMKYGLTEDGDTWQDSKGEWHLNANSKFAAGITENVFDWSGRMRERLSAHGVDIGSQKAVNEVVNEIGSNKSTTMLMRALLEPLTRGQIVKEMALRDKVPSDPGGILQANDPSLKIDAFKKSIENLEAALGSGGIADQAIAVLNKLTSGLSMLGQTLEAHPKLAGFGTDMTLVATGVLGLSAAVKLLGINVGEAKAATAAAAGGGAGGSGLVPQILGLGAAVSAAQQMHALDVPSRSGWQGFIQFLDPGLADRMFGKQDGTPAAGLSLGFVGSANAAEMGSKFQNLDPSAANSDLDSMRAGLLHKEAFTTDAFDGLGKQSLVLNDNFKTAGAGVDNALKILEATALGAARALASVAMSGGGGGGSGFMNASWETGGGSPDLSAAMRGGAGAGIGHLFSAAEREGNIRSYAAKIGINPDVAMAVARSEGFGKFSGDHGTSFGDLQMHIGGGLGDAFRRATGKNPADPHNELELDRFALDEAKRGGWGPWHGAARIHVHGMYGIGQAPTVSAPPARRVAPGNPAAGGHDVEAALHRALGQVAMNVNLTYDQKHQRMVASFVTKHQASTNRFPRDMGGPDNHGHYLSPGTPVTDAA